MTEEDIILALIVELEARFPEPRLFSFESFRVNEDNNDGWGLQLTMIGYESNVMLLCVRGRIVIERLYSEPIGVSALELADPESVERVCRTVREWVAWHLTHDLGLATGLHQSPQQESDK